MRDNTPFKPGDIVCTTRRDKDPSLSHRLVGYGIRRYQGRWHSYSDAQEFIHVGIVINDEGDTFEATLDGGYKKCNLYEDYDGRRILIGRHKNITQKAFARVHSMMMLKYNDKPYPMFRMVAFLLMPWFKPVARLAKKPVCSELAYKYMWLMGLRGEWMNVIPARVAWEIKNDTDYEIIFHGCIIKNEKNS